MSVMRATWITAVLAAACAGGCDGRGRGAETAHGAAPAPLPPPPAAVAAAAPAGPVERADGEEYVVEVRHEAQATTGRPTTAVFTGTGKPPWHVNPEYPAKLEVISAEGFTAPAQAFRGADAAQFDQTQLRFEVPLTPTQTGDRPVQFKFKFGLCSSDRCVSREAVLGWSYAVAGG